MTVSLQAHLDAVKANGQKVLVPYVTAGVRDDWLEIVRAVIDAGANAVEIGVPFSDPVMDGPVIQAASVQALERGATPTGTFDLLADQSFDVPLAVMTYYNLAHHFGLPEFAAALAGAHVAATILPDLSLEESEQWHSAAAVHHIDNVLMVAPTTPDARLSRIAELSEGFIYAVGTMGVTGERAELASSAAELGHRAKSLTDKTVLIGVGVSTPDQAKTAAVAADGVIVGTAVIRRILEGESPAQIGEFVASLRKALS